MKIQFSFRCFNLIKLKKKKNILVSNFLENFDLYIIYITDNIFCIYFHILV